MKNIYSLTLTVACFVLCFVSVQSLNAQTATVTYTSGFFDGEISWQLVDATAGTVAGIPAITATDCDGAIIVVSPAIDACYSQGQTGDAVALAPLTTGNTYELYGYESFGDGWDISLIEVSGGGAAYGPATPFVSGTAPLGIGDCSAVTGGGVLIYSWVAAAGGGGGGPSCEIVCPADIIVDTDPGVCSATIALPPPTYNPLGCNIDTPVNPVNTTTGQVPLNFAGTMQFTSVPTPTGPAAAPCVTSVTFVVCWDTDNGGNGAGTFEASELNFPAALAADATIDNVIGNYPANGTTLLAGTTSFNMPTGNGDCTVNCYDLTVSIADYNAWNGGTFSLDADTGINLFCGTDWVEISTSVPTACAPFGATGVPAGGTFPLGTTNIIYNGTGSGSGSGLSFPLECSFNVTVCDNEAPVLVCPIDRTVNLQGGECEQIYEFAIIATDNCGLAPANIDPPVEYGGAFGGLANCLGQGASLSCGFGPTSQTQEIETGSFPSNFILTDGCFIFDNTSWGNTICIVNFYSDVAGLNAAQAALPCYKTHVPFATSGVVNLVGLGLVPGQAVCVPVFDSSGDPYVYDSAAGGLYMEVRTGNDIGGGGGIAWNGPSCNGITSNGTRTWLCSDGCGDGYFATFGFNTIDAFFAIQGSEFDEFDTPMAPGLNEFVSGDNLPIGTHCFQFGTTDVGGNTAECGWCITVNEFPEDQQVTSLACNDLVHVSLDEGCDAVIGADMFLEGGPYGCYDTDYAVYISGYSGNQNGASIPLTCGTTYTVTVVDVDTGISCWGEMLAEDKLDPVVEVPDDITLNCLQSTAPGTPIDGTNNAATTVDPIASWSDATTGLVAESVLTAPAATTGAIVTKVTASVQLDHSWMGDVDMFLVGPDGTTVMLLDGSTGCNLQDNMNATFDDDASGGAACVATFTAGVHEACNVPALWTVAAAIDGTFSPIGDLSDFNGISPGGDWTLQVFDNVGGDGGCLRGFQLEIDWTCPAAASATIANECGNETLTYTDQYFDNDCDGALIQRTWVATDACGNSGTGVQNIFVTQIGASGEGSEWFWPRNPVELTCGSASSPDDVYYFFRTRWSIANPLLESWVAWPDEYQDEIALWECNAHAAGVRMAYPHHFNKKGLQESFLANNCNMLFTYDDLVLPACGAGCNGNNKIIRTWTALDWCTAETRTAVQVIHAKDNTPPTFDLQSSMTVSASPWGCAATFYLPVPEHMHDNCSEDVYYRIYGKPGTVTEVDAGPYYDAAAGAWRVDGLPKAGSPHEYIYEAYDCCGNIYTRSLYVEVVDGSAPIAVAKQNIVISLTSSPTDPNGGLAKLFSHSVDNGSHDGDCGPVRIAIRRTDSESCGNYGAGDHNNNSTFFNFNDVPQNAQPDLHDLDDTDNGDFVKFCCADLTGPNAVDEDGDGVPDYALIDVELGVWDDANMDGVPGTPGDLFGLTWATVRVEAKLQPQLICPPKAMITCDMDENDDFVIDNMLGRAYASSTCGALATEYNDICGLDLNDDGVVANWYVPAKETFYVNESGYMWDINGDGFISSYTAREGERVTEDLFVKACHYGPIMRYWSIAGTNVSCRQIIIISEPTTLFDGAAQIDWPYSKNEFINLVDNDGRADCNGDGITNDVSTSDITLYPDNNNPQYAEVKMDCIDALCEEPAWVEANCALIGWSLDSDTFYFEGDACRKIINTYTVIDWCQYDINSPSSGGIWSWTVIGKLIDPFAPEVTANDDMFPAVPGTGGSGTNIDESPCVGVGITMSATATDKVVDSSGDTLFNACPSQWIKWNVYLDIYNDWTYEREWSSFVQEDRNTSTDPLWSEDNAADNIAVYGYPIPDVRVGNRGGVDNADDLATAPGFLYTINIPDQIPADCGEAQHRVVWKAYDGCGNVTSVTSYFTVQDKKAPTPFCINLSTALMADPDGAGPAEAMVELWAIDFDAGSFDNCTEYDYLRFTFTDTPPEADPYYNSSSNSSSHIFTCEDLNGASPAFLTIPVYVWDECGNYDFCLVNLRLVDNQGGCPGIDSSGSMIAGLIETPFGATIENVEVMNESSIADFNMMDMTDATGNYQFAHLPNDVNYAITGSKDDDYLNGVSTLDLLLIQRHILGIELLDNPYKLIAADVNNDQQVTAVDLIELRKLILGIYDELPNNGSWRFGDANQTLDINAPWNFDEMLEINSLNTDMMHEDFVGVKIGDVNDSVEANSFTGSTEERSIASIDITFDDREIAVGELVELSITGSALNDVYGYQFTMATAGLELVDVQSGVINVSSENFASFGNLVTTSWNSTNPISTDDALFTMTFRATVSGTISDIIDVNSEITRAEAYVGSDLAIVNIDIDNNTSTESAEFALYQNEPNPFTTTTVIGFVMPETADAALTVYDVTGKVIKLVDGNFAKGYNEIELSKSDLGAAGVLYYQLDSGDFTATKKMIIIE